MKMATLATPRGAWLTARAKLMLLLACLIAFEAALSVAFYVGLTKDVPGANDFYVPWRATQALLLDHRNPYSADVTREIQLGMFGRPQPPDQHQFGFAYPLYTSLLIAPLVMLPYNAAEAIWLAVLFSLLIGSALLALRDLGIHLKPPPLALFTLWVILFYPSARSLILGQLAVVVFACVVGAHWALRQRHDTLAGVLLALTTIKPQMVLLWLPLVLIWALHQRRSKLTQSFAATLALLLFVTLALQPTWITDFARTATAYSTYFDSLSPLQVVLGDNDLALIVSFALMGALLWATVRSARRGWHDRDALFLWSLILTQLVALHTSTTNQVVLILPIFFGLTRSPLTARVKLIWLLLLLCAPWLLFLATKHGDQESALALLPLSFGVALWSLAEATHLRARVHPSLAQP